MGRSSREPHARPYLVDGAQKLIQEGSHREVMGWIMFVLIIATTAIQHDAPEAEKSFFQVKLDRLFQELGFGALHEVETRLHGARELARTIFMIADEMVERRPEDKETMEAQ